MKSLVPAMGLVLACLVGCETAPEMAVVGRAIVPAGAVAKSADGQPTRSNICVLELALLAPADEGSSEPRASQAAEDGDSGNLQLLGKRRVRLATAGYAGKETPATQPADEDDSELPPPPPGLLGEPLFLDVRVDRGELESGQTVIVSVHLRNESNEPADRLMIVLLPSAPLTYLGVAKRPDDADLPLSLDRPADGSLRFAIDRTLEPGQSVRFEVALRAAF